MCPSVQSQACSLYHHGRRQTRKGPSHKTGLGRCSERGLLGVLTTSTCSSCCCSSFSMPLSSSRARSENRLVDDRLQPNSPPPSLAARRVLRHLCRFGKSPRSHRELGNKCATRDNNHQSRKTSTHRRKTSFQVWRQVHGRHGERHRVCAGNVNGSGSGNCTRFVLEVFYYVGFVEDPEDGEC